MSSLNIEERLAALELRAQKAEDHLELLNLLNSYGPLVDSGSDQHAADLWVQGGGYNFSMPDGSAQRLEAPEELAGMYRWPGHMDLVNTGCAHFTGTPKIVVTNDDAQAIGYSFVILREGERWCVWRAAVNHWTFRRTPAGWRIAERFNRVLNGSELSLETMKKVAVI